jgi:hypothetical protein
MTYQGSLRLRGRGATGGLGRWLLPLGLPYGRGGVASQHNLNLATKVLSLVHPGEPTSRWSIPDTRVTVHSGDMGNTFGPNGLSIGSSRHVSSRLPRQSRTRGGSLYDLICSQEQRLRPAFCFMVRNA